VGSGLTAAAVPEVWAGPECSFLTVGDWACDQLTLTGHDRRLADIDRLARLGVSAVRYPVLWGRDRRTGEATDWGWSATRLARLETRGLRPVLGLLHHGFGPAGADPLQPGWARRFAAYAARVAVSAPAGASFLPLNEPLTTARFGGLYGWWPPYRRDPAAFAALLLAQAEAYLLAARAIRAVRPGATILLNEDVGRTIAAPGCRDVADRHNERRWLSFDLVTGRVDHSHPAWSALAATRRGRRVLELLRTEPEPPDVLGVDHYVTSDRYVDDRLEEFPAHTHAHEGGRIYADVEVARVHGHAVGGFARAIGDAWDRYRLPVALTEVQLAGDPEEQAAWWNEAWAAAEDATRRGIPVRSVTAWSAFGAYDWSSVLRTPRGAYEAGAYDASAPGAPRRTALGEAIAATAAGRPAPPATGWWRRPDRACYWPDGPAAARRSSAARIA
jgi:dTDP-4-dehydrorhamnose reductase